MNGLERQQIEAQIDDLNDSDKWIISNHVKVM